jgi:hypothetical protein
MSGKERFKRGYAFAIFSFEIESVLTFRRISVPGGPTTITSSKVKRPKEALTDLDFITVTLGD